MLGQFLGFLLHTNETAVLAIYSSTENRTAQLKMVESAAKSTLSQDESDVVSVLLSQDIKPTVKYRDKLAHWNWGYAAELPECLILSDPNKNRLNLSLALKQTDSGIPKTKLNPDYLYVVTQKDLESALQQLQRAHDTLILAMSFVWQENSPEGRAERFHQLSR
jgi:hypothetical protein